MQYREIIAVCSEIHIKHINALCGQNVEFLGIKPGGTYSNHLDLKGSISVIKSSQLMLYREIIALCSQIHTERINTLCGENVEFLNVKPGGTYSNHLALRGSISVIKTSQLMLYREIIAVCSQIHTIHKFTLCAERRIA
jgi:RecB family endonuclease NucS